MITYRWSRVPWGPHETWNSGMTLGTHERQFLKMTHKNLVPSCNYQFSDHDPESTL